MKLAGATTLINHMIEPVGCSVVYGNYCDFASDRVESHTLILV